MKRIAIILGHPDASHERFCYALAEAYKQGAQQGGHECRLIEVGRLNFSLLRCRSEWEADAEADIQEAQETLSWAEHWVIIYPLWLGDMPALLKAFLEQVLRPGFALQYENGWPKSLLKGKSAHLIVTTGMPALAYHWFYGAHSLKSLKRNVLQLCGIQSVRSTVIGSIEAKTQQRSDWLQKIGKIASHQ
ncbi:MAG: NAD(P)H-dependent oxidoreductase [Burkholderiales bacterium]|nr:NAD(P)H-dependent oxidoreductase [Burkholderiales bacterium]MCA3162161.1 NAD(P)H-dependent oxidoreductase [Burkholderiales bacterium]MCA3163255.1 NAD(P)H-dependent oxidoreductase [Burkholderiales bacterium]MCA3165989.1 NAD(P)H-dependent oxidoreductase [Burkholderiales bacterium]MCA3171107.1 NAD(P)H-dependent oxidoreductase [Burkholderiales bacterium]